MTAIGKVAEKNWDMWRRARSRRLVGWVGHGEGLNIHEPPYLVENSNVIIREGMIIAVEIQSFSGRKFANMPEDAYLITEDGFEKLTRGTWVPPMFTSRLNCRSSRGTCRRF